jgi:hypothetical protein
MSKERITSVADHYFTNLWCVGGSLGRGAPSIEYRDRQKSKERCVKTFVEKYDTVTTPSGEGKAVRKEMTVQTEQWWNSSDVSASLREENAWDADGTVAVVGKKMRSCWRVCITIRNRAYVRDTVVDKEPVLRTNNGRSFAFSPEWYPDVVKGRGRGAGGRRGRG